MTFPSSLKSARSPAAKAARRSASSQREAGLSLLVALVLVAAMGILLAANATTLHWLKQELRRVEEHQAKRAQPAPGPNPSPRP